METNVDSSPVAGIIRHASLVFLGLFFVLLYSTTPRQNQISKIETSMQLYKTEQCQEDELKMIRTTCCSDPELPVLGGVDVVELFSYTDDKHVPLLGSPTLAAILPTRVGNFKFLFLNEENRAKFLVNPWQYAPAWGGFCAMGIGYESQYFTSSSRDRLGPNVDLSTWTIVNGRLYFFGGEGPKLKFLESLPDAISYGDAHWSNMFGGVYDGHFDTNCFHRQEFFDSLRGVKTLSDDGREENGETGGDFADDGVEVEEEEEEKDSDANGFYAGHTVVRNEEGIIIEVDGIPVAPVTTAQVEKVPDKSLYDKYAAEKSLWREIEEPSYPTKQDFLSNHDVDKDTDGQITEVDGIMVIKNKYSQIASEDISKLEEDFPDASPGLPDQESTEQNIGDVMSNVEADEALIQEPNNDIKQVEGAVDEVEKTLIPAYEEDPTKTDSNQMESIALDGAESQLMPVDETNPTVPDSLVNNQMVRSAVDGEENTLMRVTDPVIPEPQYSYQMEENHSVDEAEETLMPVDAVEPLNPEALDSNQMESYAVDEAEKMLIPEDEPNPMNSETLDSYQMESHEVDEAGQTSTTDEEDSTSPEISDSNKLESQEPEDDSNQIFNEAALEPIHSPDSDTKEEGEQLSSEEAREQVFSQDEIVESTTPIQVESEGKLGEHMSITNVVEQQPKLDQAVIMEESSANVATPDAADLAPAEKSAIEVVKPEVMPTAGKVLETEVIEAKIEEIKHWIAQVEEAFPEVLDDGYFVVEEVDEENNPTPVYRKPEDEEFEMMQMYRNSMMQLDAVDGAQTEKKAAGHRVLYCAPQRPCTTISKNAYKDDLKKLDVVFNRDQIQTGNEEKETVFAPIYPVSHLQHFPKDSVAFTDQHVSNEDLSILGSIVGVGSKIQVAENIVEISVSSATTQTETEDSPPNIKSLDQESVQVESNPADAGSLSEKRNSPTDSILSESIEHSNVSLNSPEGYSTVLESPVKSEQFADGSTNSAVTKGVAQQPVVAEVISLADEVKTAKDQAEIIDISDESETQTDKIISEPTEQMNISPTIPEENSAVLESPAKPEISAASVMTKGVQVSESFEKTNQLQSSLTVETAGERNSILQTTSTQGVHDEVTSDISEAVKFEEFEAPSEKLQLPNSVTEGQDSRSFATEQVYDVTTAFELGSVAGDNELVDTAANQLQPNVATMSDSVGEGSILSKIESWSELPESVNEITFSLPGTLSEPLSNAASVYQVHQPLDEGNNSGVLSAVTNINEQGEINLHELSFPQNDAPTDPTKNQDEMNVANEMNSEAWEDPGLLPPTGEEQESFFQQVSSGKADDLLQSQPREDVEFNEISSQINSGAYTNPMPLLSQSQQQSGSSQQVSSGQPDLMKQELEQIEEVPMQFHQNDDALLAPIHQIQTGSTNQINSGISDHTLLIPQIQQHEDLSQQVLEDNIPRYESQTEPQTLDSFFVSQVQPDASTEQTGILDQPHTNGQPNSLLLSPTKADVSIDNQQDIPNQPYTGDEQTDSNLINQSDLPDLSLQPELGNLQLPDLAASTEVSTTREAEAAVEAQSSESSVEAQSAVEAQTAVDSQIPSGVEQTVVETRTAVEPQSAEEQPQTVVEPHTAGEQPQTVVAPQTLGEQSETVVEEPQTAMDTSDMSFTEQKAARKAAKAAQDAARQALKASPPGNLRG